MACTGNQYGGFEHTLFLGCSVVSFAANAYNNQQSTEVTIELVEDDCVAPATDPKYYWDLGLIKRSTLDADPGFMGESVPIIGLPAYFRLGDFEFTGLIQSWERTENNGGIRYVVKLVSPVQILEDSQLILGEYAGSVTPPSAFILPPSYSPYNIINIFGYAEAQGLLCPQYSQIAPGVYAPGDSGPDGATFGTPAGGFGGSLLNPNGMPWSVIRDIFNVLVNANPIIAGASAYSPHGRILHKGADIVSFGSPWTNGYGILDFDRSPNFVGETLCEYFVDISELPAVPSYYRFNQSEASILEIVSRICEDAGYDFYVELLPVQSAISSSGIVKFIKIRTISRINNPTFGILDTYINDAAASGILVASSSGREFRNETVSKFVVGGKKQTLYQAYQNFDPFNDGQPNPPEADDMILPFFGTDLSGNMIVPYLDTSGYWEFQAPSDSIESSLTYLTFSGLPVTINERELQASADQSIWASYIIDQQTDTGKALDDIFNLVSFPTAEQVYHRQMAFRTDFFKKNNFIVPGSGEFYGAARDFNALSAQGTTLTNPIAIGIQEDVQKLHQWISNYATEYYGKKFAIRVPYTCAYVDGENQQITLSEQPTQDGGWTEVSDVIGMPLNSDEVTFFRNDSNKIETIVAYTGFNDLDVSELDELSYVVYNNNLYIKGTVDSEYVFHNSTGFLIPRAIVEIPSPITLATVPDKAIVHGMIRLAGVLPTGSNEVNFQGIFQAYQNVGAKGAASTMHDQAFIPDACAFGIISNINTYGPWVSLGPAGGIEVEKNDNLVPWEYGSYTNLNAAGNALAQAGTTNMQVGEMGSITVVGYPTIPLGAELTSLTLLAGNQLVENRSVSVGTYVGNFAGNIPFAQSFIFFNYGFSQLGANGPTVTNIAVQVGDQVTTQYSFRTYTPKFGRFARLNADRLKEVNQNRMQYVRDLRNYVRQSSQNKLSSSLGFKQSLSAGIAKLKNRSRPQDRILAAGTPHELFVGQIIGWGDSRRTLITTTSFNELPNEFDTGTYDSKAISSLETLIRPISIKGAGGLPKLIAPTLAESGTSGDPQGNRWPLSQIDYNPYINPTGIDSSGFLVRRYDVSGFGGNIGHDFDLVSRANWISGNPLSGVESGLPESGLLMPRSDGSFDYRDDYRTFALRGPILIQSWGYDLNNKPIPNKVDSITGIQATGFAVSGLEDTFMSGFSHNPESWPVAPLEMRLDRQRGLWVAGNSTTIFRGRAVNASNSSGTPVTVNNVTFLQGSDPAISGVNSTIVAINEMNWDIPIDNLIYGIYHQATNEYIIWQTNC